MHLRDKLKPYTIEAIQTLGGYGKLKDIREETIRILTREGKLGYVFQTGPRLYQQRWTLELLKEEGILEHTGKFWRLKEVPNIFNLVADKNSHDIPEYPIYTQSLKR